MHLIGWDDLQYLGMQIGLVILFTVIVTLIGLVIIGIYEGICKIARIIQERKEIKNLEINK